MIIRIAFRIIIFLTALSSFGCSMGPSDDDVFEAMEMSLAGFDKDSDAFDKEHLVGQMEYSNVATNTVQSEDGAIYHSITCTMDPTTQEMTIEGACNYYDYEHPKTGYIVNGSVEYYMFMNSKSSRLDQINFEFDVEFTGGKVETFEMSIDESGAEKWGDPEIFVNGEDYMFKKKVQAEAKKRLVAIFSGM